jgi:hypothetical protein
MGVNEPIPIKAQVEKNGRNILAYMAAVARIPS